MFDQDGRLVETPFVPSEGSARLTEKQAIAILFRNEKVADWLDRYPPKPATAAEYRAATDDWVVKAWSGKAGQIVLEGTGAELLANDAVRRAYLGET